MIIMSQIRQFFRNKNLKEIRSILDRYDDKVIWLSRKKDVEKIIKVV